MTLESLAVTLLAELAPAAIEAIAAALDTGKTEEEALAAARAHLPKRIDTATEDAVRHARIVAAHEPQLVLAARMVRQGLHNPVSESVLLSGRSLVGLRALVDHHDPQP